MARGFGDFWDCCPGRARGPLIWGHVSVILVPSSGFVPSLVPQPRSWSHGHHPTVDGVMLGIHGRWGNTGQEGLGSGQEGTLALCDDVPMVISFRLEGSASPWFQDGLAWKSNF